MNSSDGVPLPTDHYKILSLLSNIKTENLKKLSPLETKTLNNALIALNQGEKLHDEAEVIIRNLGITTLPTTSDKKINNLFSGFFNPIERKFQNFLNLRISTKTLHKNIIEIYKKQLSEVSDSLKDFRFLIGEEKFKNINNILSNLQKNLNNQFDSRDLNPTEESLFLMHVIAKFNQAKDEGGLFQFFSKAFKSESSKLKTIMRNMEEFSPIETQTSDETENDKQVFIAFYDKESSPTSSHSRASDFKDSNNSSSDLLKLSLEDKLLLEKYNPFFEAKFHFESYNTGDKGIQIKGISKNELIIFIKLLRSLESNSTFNESLSLKETIALIKFNNEYGTDKIFSRLDTILTRTISELDSSNPEHLVQIIDLYQSDILKKIAFSYETSPNISSIPSSFVSHANVAIEHFLQNKLDSLTSTTDKMAFAKLLRDTNISRKIYDQLILPPLVNQIKTLDPSNPEHLQTALDLFKNYYSDRGHLFSNFFASCFVQAKSKEAKEALVQSFQDAQVRDLDFGSNSKLKLEDVKAIFSIESLSNLTIRDPKIPSKVIKSISEGVKSSKSRINFIYKSRSGNLHY